VQFFIFIVVADRWNGWC